MVHRVTSKNHVNFQDLVSNPKTTDQNSGCTENKNFVNFNMNKTKRFVLLDARIILMFHGLT